MTDQEEKLKTLKGLNNQQRKVVLENSSNLLVIAGAGSGKTKAVTHKIAYLIDKLKNRPDEILALTFTNKAANEMKERIENLIGKAAFGMYAGTFHSVALRILRNEGINPTIYDTKDQMSVIKEILKLLNIDHKKYPPNKFINYISQYKQKLLTPDQIMEASPFDKMVKKIFLLYEKKLQEANAVDFDNIIIKLIDLLKNNSTLRNKYANKFKYIFIDEYQDTNYPQYILINLLHSDNNFICAVGDEDQSIYGWRGADIGNILRFDSEYENCKVIKLERNYRSCQNILSVANSLIKENNLRKGKVLYTEIPGGNVSVKTLSTDIEEAYFVVNKIIALKDKGEHLSNMAILYRTNAQSRLIEDAIVKKSIPYRVIGSKKFFDRKEIKDIIAYMKLIKNEDDDVAFLRAVNSHAMGIGKKLLEIIQSHAEKNTSSYFRSSVNLIENNSLNKRQTTALSGFVEIINDLKKDSASDIKLPDMIDEIFKKSGYFKFLEEGKQHGRIDNIMELENAATTANLNDFLDKISLLDYSNDLSEAEDAVNLMTLHTSKGLEFSTVFITGLEEGLFPNANLKNSQMDMEEERRLFYVAITRAKHNLFITCAQYRNKHNKQERMLPSRFLKELGRIDSQGALRSDKKNYTEKIKRGSRIRHGMYGDGVILAVDDSKNAKILTVNFYKEGIKKILSKDRNLQFI